jgi:hypothetical protein
VFSTKACYAVNRIWHHSAVTILKPRFRFLRSKTQPIQRHRLGQGKVLIFRPFLHLKSSRDCCSSNRSCRRSAKACLVYLPCLCALLLPRGAPEPAAPPCRWHRRLPVKAGAMHGLPDLVFAPQRGLDSIATVLRCHVMPQPWSGVGDASLSIQPRPFVCRDGRARPRLVLPV